MPSAYDIAANHYDRPTKDDGKQQHGLRYSRHASAILSFFVRHRIALRANIDETTTSSFITVEGEEVNQDGRSWKTSIRTAAHCWL